MSYQTLSIRFACSLSLLFAMAIVFTGCSGNHTPPAVANSDKALESLKTTLDSWQAGATPDALRKAKPTILAADDDWQAGVRLVKYEVSTTPQTAGTAQSIPVVLDLEGPAGTQRKAVNYIVNTNPILSVVRQEQE